MKSKEYKSLPAFAIALLLGAAAVSAAAPAGRNEDQLARSTLAQVESLARASRSLDRLGKDTMTQAATFLDLGDDGLPVLVRASIDRRKDWKVRFWTVDLLGYVGREDTVPYLLQAAANARERREVRLRALDSIAGISGRKPVRLAPVRAALRRLRKRTRDRRVRRKIGSVLAKLGKRP